MKTKNVEWVKIGNDDFKANFEKYFLRVERMGDKRFWYALYLNQKEVLMDTTFGIFATSKKQAKKLCELAMWVHRFTN